MSSSNLIPRNDPHLDNTNSGFTEQPEINVEQIKDTSIDPDSNRSKDENGFFTDETYIDQIINKSGYCREVWKIIFLASLSCLLEGMHFTLFSIIFTPFQKYYNLDSMTVSAISASIFLFIGAGSVLIGTLTKYYKRTSIINFSLLMVCVFNIFMGVVNNYIAFTIFRGLIGFFIGIIVPICLAILAEYLPLYFRSFTMNAVWFTFSIGSIILISICFAVMPHLESNRMTSVLLLMSIPCGAVLWIFVGLLNDSPRNLILNKEFDKAWIILERISHTPLTQNIKQKLISQICHGENDSSGGTRSSIATLFNPKFHKTTIYLIFIFFFVAVCLYGPNIIQELTIHQLHPKRNGNVLMKEMTILLISLPGFFAGGLLTEIKFLGRKISMLLCGLFYALFSCLGCAVWLHIEIFLGITLNFSNMGYNIAISYANEVYPTKVRSTATGFLFGWTRFGGFVSQFLGVGIAYIHIFAPYYFFAVIAAITGVLCMLLPYETLGRPMDQVMNTEENETLEINDEKSKILDVEKHKLI